MPQKSRRVPNQEEVKRRWGALTIDQRLLSMSFDDPVLINRIKTSLQGLFENQQAMIEMGEHMGLRMADAPDPFAASALLTGAFEFTWQVGRCATNPELVLIDSTRTPIMVMKRAFIEKDRLFEDMKAVMPEFLAPRGGCLPTPRARWKEFFTIEPSSISAMERQLAKLVEQALWAMCVNPSFEAPAQDDDILQVGDGASLPLEDESWMESESNVKATTKKKKKSRRRSGGAAATQTAVAGEAEDEISGIVVLVGEESKLALESSKALSAEAPKEGHTAIFGDEDGEAGTCASMTCASCAITADHSASDDESVGVGSFHGSCVASTGELSQEPTATSTPALGRCGRSVCFPGSRLSSPRQLSPRRDNSSLPLSSQPHNLVFYIWCQTSQLAQCEAANDGQDSSLYFASRASAQRGKWLAPSAPGTPLDNQSAVVFERNTFVEVDDRKDFWPTPCRTSRSLSPSCRHDDCEDFGQY